MPTHIRTRTAATAAAVVCLSSLAFANTVFSQPPVTDPAGVGLGFYSHTAPTPTNSFLHAHNFALDTDTPITAVRWWGASEGADSPDLDNINAFEITIYSHGFFYPDQALYTERFTLADADATATGRSGNGVNEYIQEATLAQAFQADAGATYWIAIAAELNDSTGDGWLWADAQAGDGTSASLRYSTGNWMSTSPYDSAYELITVPAPAAAIPAFTILAAARRRPRGS